jgi:hypothetical protein
MGASILPELGVDRPRFWIGEFPEAATPEIEIDARSG